MAAPVKRGRPWVSTRESGRETRETRLTSMRAEKLSRPMLIRLVVVHGLERLRALLKGRQEEVLQVDLLEPQQQTLWSKAGAEEDSSECECAAAGLKGQEY